MSSLSGAATGRETDARQQLMDMLGSENVIDDPVVLEQYSRDMSFAPARRPAFVVRPRETEQVQQLVKWANRTLMPLVPVSSGPPHFRGDTVPSLGGVVVDLSSMKKILRVDRRNRVAMIEPGVTFSDLKPEVEKQGMRLSMPLVPRATKSVIGSCLEREPVLVPRHHWDMSDPLCCTEVVFGTGDLFRTGAAAGPGTLEQQWESGQAQKNPLGPGPTDFHRVVQGAQGTLGIVTWATVRLELLPSIRKLFMVGCENVDNILDFVHWTQRLKLVDECLVLDRLNLASILEQDAAAIEQLRAELPPYVLVCVIAGYERFPEQRVDYQTKDMMEVGEKCGVRPSETLPGVDPEALLHALSEPCPPPYWKLRYKGNSADVCFLTTLDRTPEFIQVMNETAHETGFPATGVSTYVQPIQQGRSCHVEFSLAFDPNEDAEAARARNTFDQAGKRLMNTGAFFSRPYGLWSEMMGNQQAENVIALRKVKGIFDPNNVMNPGKLSF